MFVIYLIDYWEIKADFFLLFDTKECNRVKISDKAILSKLTLCCNLLYFSFLAIEIGCKGNDVATFSYISSLFV